jgi:uncharacterized repeat protein (TIGR01451 family)
VKNAAVFTLVAVLAVAAACLAVVARSQTVPPPGVPVEKVEICHKPPAPPRSEVSVESIVKEGGHDIDDTDIIPPFTYETDSGGTAKYPGKNWTLQGQATWYYGCDPADVPDVTPTVQCVESRSDGLYAHFGYKNSESATVNIPVSLVNRFDPTPGDRDQPEAFQPGTHPDVFTVPFSDTLRWILAGRSETASSDTPRCQASIRIDKALDPSNDPGHFDLLLDGQALATGVGNGGTTDTHTVSTGTHTVGERAGRGTNLADYDITIVCRANGGTGEPPVAQGTGPSIRVTVTAGQAIVCVILNRRNGTPAPGEYDLQVVKSASPRSVLVGQQVTWRVQVRNNGPGTATNVVVEDSLPRDMSFVDGSVVLSPGLECVGARCTIASLAPGASVSGRFMTTATAVGTKTNTVTVTSRGDTNPANNAASAQVLVTGRVDPDVTPILECVEQTSGGYRAHYGYLNHGAEAVTVPIGVGNAFQPKPEDRGQPRRFEPGRAPDVFQVDFEGSVSWELTGKTSTASQGSKRCAPTQGSLRVDKILSPPNDPGRFDLEIDGVPAGTGRNVGHLGTTGDVAVPAGQHRVGEEGVGGTSLANYATTIACRANRGRGAVNSAFNGPELVVDVAAGQEVVCTIVNTRRMGPPVPPPEPPLVPTPPPEPQPGTSDLSVVKFVNQRIGTLGDIATWTIVVKNNGPEVATGVRIVDAAAARATIVSLQVSQGTCGRTTCSLGTIQPGASVRIVVSTRMLTVGARLNTVIVRGDQPDSVRENNVASALVRILSAFTPPLAQRCNRLSIDRRIALVGSSVLVRASVRNVFGRPLAGTVVRARGAGQLSAARTNRLGIALVGLAPNEAGIVRFTVGARTLTAAGARRCTARLGVLAAAGIAPGVTG